MALKRQTDVLVVGAGPVGLFAALSLAERGLQVQIVDKEWRGAAHSYALMLHPASLRLLDEYGAADELLEQGQRVERLEFYEGDERTGEIDLTRLARPFPFVLVAPQSALEQALEKRLRQHGVKIAWNHQVLDFKQDAEATTTRVARMEKYLTGYPVAHSEWLIAKEIDVHSAFLLGADGYHSQIRKTLGITYAHAGDADAFSVYEFPGRLPFQHEARIVFSGDTLNVIWPLDEQRGRWSFKVEPDNAPDPTMESLAGFVRERAPWFRSEVGEIDWSTTVLFERRLADAFGRGRVWLAGDAGHITGPVGGQSMNVGLREAHDLGERFSAVLKAGTGMDRLDDYERERQAEWTSLLGQARVGEGAPEWIRKHTARILPCLPASGDDLADLLQQVGLVLEQPTSKAG